MAWLEALGESDEVFALRPARRPGVAGFPEAIPPALEAVRARGTAVVRILVARAEAARVRLVMAHTLAEESASTAVLRRCDFRRVGEVVDADGVPVWRWELPLDLSPDGPAPGREGGDPP
jgi:hypothetical protein